MRFFSVYVILLFFLLQWTVDGRPGRLGRRAATGVVVGCSVVLAHAPLLLHKTAGRRARDSPYRGQTAPICVQVSPRRPGVSQVSPASS